MKKTNVSGLAVLTLALAGAAQVASAAPKASVRVVSGAKPLSLADKASITGKGGTDDCCCPKDFKPGYGFGTTGHYGPPGQDFTPEESWRRWVAAGNTDVTPAGHPLPGQALVRP